MVWPLLGPAAPAFAHASLLASTPAAGYAVSTSPRSLTLVFDQPVAIGAQPLQLTGGAGRIAIGAARLTHGDRWLSAGVSTRLASGEYTVHWQVTASDGDAVGGQYTFGVGVAQVHGTRGTATRGLTEAVVLRWVLFGALSVALGGLVGLALARRVVAKAGAAGRDLVQPYPPVRKAAAVGAVAAIGLTAHVLGSGDILTGLPDLVSTAWLHNRAARVGALQAAAFVLAAGAAGRSSRGRTALVAASLIVVVAAEGQRSHLYEDAGGIGSVLVALHLAAAAVWLGALTHVITVAWQWRARRVAAHRIVWEYARIAVALLVVVLTTGAIASTVVLRRPAELVTTGYGRLLLAKLGLVIAVGGCAIAARRRLARTSPLRPTGDTTVTQPGVAARAEGLLLAAVLACTAALVSIAAPRSAGASFVAVPPPAGPVVSLAALDGQITVYATASDGRLEVRTSTPDPTGTGSGSSTNISARSGRGRIALSRCGPACFVGPAHWAAGSNRVSITATSPRWTGGTAGLTVPWPPIRSDHLLARVIAAMRRTATVTVHETVTSNTADPAPAPGINTLTGPDFVSVEPYGQGGQLPVIQLARDADLTTIAFALVAQDYYFQLTLAADDRIQGEIITTPQHLYTRTFDYPGPARPPVAK
ncbi:MAG TPA: copper resistance protein CopC [Jatrophihabitantaceae bacterium]